LKRESENLAMKRRKKNRGKKGRNLFGGRSANRGRLSKGEEPRKERKAYGKRQSVTMQTSCLRNVNHPLEARSNTRTLRREGGWDRYGSQNQRETSRRCCRKENSPHKMSGPRPLIQNHSVTYKPQLILKDSLSHQERQGNERNGRRSERSISCCKKMVTLKKI